MYEHILVPTDGSEGTARAVENALEIAERFDSTIHALFVVDAATTFPADFNMDRLIDKYEEEGENAVEDIAGKSDARGVDVVTAVREGDPFEVINRYAETNDIDMVVMGTHGRSGVDRLVMGSVAERVVRTSEVPVLTVRMSE